MPESVPAFRAGGLTHRPSRTLFCEAEVSALADVVEAPAGCRPSSPATVEVASVHAPRFVAGV
ncbi:hypothetical protein AB0F77_05905 [Streptomyces sp. NPDC026672]|uniref:hypothetical protein n=1 Tax=unclassified Streptomyces TaxID=2593676 RepID=UPI0033FC8D83